MEKTNSDQPTALLAPDAVGNRHVTMSNRLARSAQGLNLAEKRLVALGLSRTDSMAANQLPGATSTGWKMKLTALEYATTFKVDPTTAYEQIKAASEKLFERFVRYEIEGRNGKPIERKFRWVSAASYAPGEGYVELNFTPEIAPHLLGLRQQFTTYQLQHAAVFDSVYAWRLFELFKSWKSTGLYITSVTEFQDVMEVPPSCRTDFKALRVRVIEPACESIRRKAAMLVEWKPIRSGSRRVTNLEFRFAPDPQTKLDIGDPGEDTPQATEPATP